MKAYWIAHVDISDPEQYVQYTQRGPAAFAEFGGRILARGGRSETMEGRPAPQRTVVIEFESYDQAVACYRSQTYQNAMQFRQGAAEADIIIVEGVAP